LTVAQQKLFELRRIQYFLQFSARLLAELRELGKIRVFALAPLRVQVGPEAIRNGYSVPKRLCVRQRPGQARPARFRGGWPCRRGPPASRPQQLLPLARIRSQPTTLLSGSVRHHCCRE
jgi:hypothetical protein